MMGDRPEAMRWQNECRIQDVLIHKGRVSSWKLLCTLVQVTLFGKGIKSCRVNIKRQKIKKQNFKVLSELLPVPHASEGRNTKIGQVDSG